MTIPPYTRRPLITFFRTYLRSMDSSKIRKLDIINNYFCMTNLNNKFIDKTKNFNSNKTSNYQNSYLTFKYVTKLRFRLVFLLEVSSIKTNIDTTNINILQFIKTRSVLQLLVKETDVFTTKRCSLRLPDIKRHIRRALHGFIIFLSYNCS